MAKLSKKQQILGLTDYAQTLLQDAVKPYAFHSSDFPLILSIENHCSRKQQERMAEHLTAILGEIKLGLQLKGGDPQCYKEDLQFHM